MKNKPVVTVNPSLDDKYKNIKLSAEHQKKHNDLIALLDRMQVNQQTQSTI